MKIAIMGKAGSGKDTIADYMVEKYGYKKVSFAMGLKNVATGLYFMKGKDRKLLQDLGTALRSVRKSVFIDYTLSKVEENTVISDLRFEDEYRRLTEEGFFIIKVEAPTMERLERISKRDGIVIDDEYLKILSSPIECYLDDENKFFANIIKNDGSIEDLYKKIDSIMPHLDKALEVSLKKQREGLKNDENKDRASE